MLCRMGLYAEDKKEKYQMAELQHGRLAMIAIGGMIRARAASPRNAATPRARPIARPRRTPTPPARRWLLRDGLRRLRLDELGGVSCPGGARGGGRAS